MKSYTATTPLEFGSPTLATDMKEQIKKHGVTLVNLYDPNDATLLKYEASLGAVMARVKPGGGTANGARNMGGITKGYGGPCTTEAWDIRLDRKAKECYKSLYTGIELSIGCDAYVGLEEDAKRTFTNEKKRTPVENSFFKLTGGSLHGHIDVHPTKMTSPGNQALEKLKTICEDFPFSIQGQLVLRSIPKGGATFICAPGEHMTTNPAHFNCHAKGDFATCTHAGYEHLQDKWCAVDNLEAGKLILWDSRLPHGNKLADEGVDRKRRGLFICWQPTALVNGLGVDCKLIVKNGYVRVIFNVTDERSSLKKRKWEAITNGGSTDHWTGYVPGGNKGHAGNHYSNGKKLSVVIHSESNPVVFDAEMTERIEAAL